MTDPKTYIAPAEEKMEMAVAYLDETLARIRAGKANAKILDAVRVEYYGSMVPVSNVANVSVPDARKQRRGDTSVDTAADRRPPQSTRETVQGRSRKRKGIGAQRTPRRH